MITGGGRGLGRAFALGLAQSGMSVAVVARTEDELAETVRQVEAAGGRAGAFRADVSNPEDVTKAVDAVGRTFGKIDLLINSAGVIGPIGPGWTVDLEDWWSCIEVNLRGTFLCCQAVLPGMLARGHGRIINVASEVGASAVPHMSAYNVSKTAVMRFTETLAAELREHGIPVFTITPGAVRTAMTEELITSEAGRRWVPWSAKIFENKRDVTEEPATALVLFLSTGAGDQLAGRVLSALEPPHDFVRHIEQVQREDLYTLRLRRPDSLSEVVVRKLKNRLRPVKRTLEARFPRSIRSK
jgi:NAD(P)-dependent dehydrogenase (short-subunit alcohol dehydrogenase family)